MKLDCELIYLNADKEQLMPFLDFEEHLTEKGDDLLQVYLQTADPASCQAVKHLMQSSQFKANHVNKKGQSALFTACLQAKPKQRVSLEVLKQLLK